MITLMLVALAVLGLVVLFGRAAKGPAHTVDSLERPIKTLLRQGFSNGFLVIEVARSEKFLQLSKYIHKRGDYGIELGFPRAEWSAEYYERLLALCESDGLKYRISRAGPDDPLEFLFVDFGRDFRAASQLVRRIFLEILDVPLSARLYCRLENATPENRIVDS